MDGLIFDIDGTMWDSTEIVAIAWNEYLKGQGITDIPVTAEILRGLFGKTLPRIAAELFPSFPEPERMRLIDGCCDSEHKALVKTPAPLYDGLREVLTSLYEKYPLFIVSNCQAGYIEVFLEGTGLTKLLRGHLCPGDTGHAKADNILAIAKQYGLKSPVYIGDTMGDFEACREAGVPFVFASYGFGQVDNPDYRIEKPADLLSIF